MSETRDALLIMMAIMVIAAAAYVMAATTNTTSVSVTIVCPNGTEHAVTQSTTIAC